MMYCLLTMCHIVTYQVELERLERLKLENAVKTGSLPDDDKVDLTCKSPAQLVASNALAKLASHSLSG